MAYARWSSGPWYIFWLAASATKREEQRLAIWHQDVPEHPSFAYTEVRRFMRHPEEMQGKVPGYRGHWNEPFLLEQMRKFIDDVDRRFGPRRKNYRRART